MSPPWLFSREEIIAMSVTAILAAAGSGSRMGMGERKQYIEICGKPLLSYSLEVFLGMDEIEAVVLVIPEGDRMRIEKDLLKGICGKEKIIIVNGGASRQESVSRGILAVPEGTETIVVHDGARPFVTKAMISECVQKAKFHGACCAAVPVKDTIKYSSDGRTVDSTPERGCLFSIQTPQAFDFGLIKRAHEKARADGFEGTDDAVLVEALDEKVVLSKGSYENIKLTSPEDVPFAEVFAGRKWGVSK